ncbi:MAG: glycosyltransferase family 4 protein, partial [Actinobacteria bacterium]|nr:glycosyltransferase family 4 protein [Actinomycetota bacterium]
VAQRLETAAVIRTARKVVVTTTPRCDTLRRWFPDRRGDIVAIPIGATIEPDPTRPLNGTRAQYGLSDSDFVIAHVGSIGAGRDFGPVFDALRDLKREGISARLLCIGRAGSSEAPADLAANVIFTGVLPRAEISDALRASDAYVFCEPSGPAAGRKTSLLAAFAHGLPVVAYSGKDSDEGLRGGDNVILVRPRATDVTQALRSLATDAGKRESLGANARRLYESRFAWQLGGIAFERILGAL